MILAIDVGNTHTVIGGLKDDALCFTLRIRSDRNKTVDEYVLYLKGLLELKGVDLSQVEGGIISSVVPELKTELYEVLLQLTGKKMLVVGAGLKTGLNIRMDYPAQLGADLVVGSVAALAAYKPPIAIFDMGTATTLAVLDKEGSYIGGMIVPGLQLSMDALSAHTAQLPYIYLGPPPRLIGTNTVDCMQAGAIYSSAAVLDGLSDRVEEELGEPLTVVATGGLMNTVLPYCKRKIHYHENLMLEGLNVLYHKNQPGRR